MIMNQSLEELNQQIAKQEQELFNLQKITNPLLTKQQKLSQSISNLREQRDALKISQSDPDVLDFELIMDGMVGWFDTTAKYREQNRQLAKLNLRRAGYSPDTL